jgi:formylglycine-generating enzyme required for sulfatase activity
MRTTVLVILGVAVCLALVSCGRKRDASRRAEENTAQAPKGAPGREASAQAPKELTLTLPGAGQVKLTMRRIPAGTFIMGSPMDEYDRNNDEGPTHEATIWRPFYMGTCEVTQEQWEKAMGSNPSHFKGPKNPVDSVSSEDAQAFIKKLNTMGLGTFRLPTEAEWEYACRAGTKTRFYWGDDPDYGETRDYAWYMHSSGRTTHPRGGRRSPMPGGCTT